MQSPFVLYNSIARTKQVFVPIHAKQVKLYVCGMTVYDFCHLGHARVMVVFDLLKRWLVSQGYQVLYVRNITDIDDKIIRRALENKEPIRQLTDRFIQAMHEDAEALGVLKPDHEPRATEFVPDMLAMISRLIENNLAYQDQNGDVLFSVRSFPNYGQLSGKSLDDLRAGERVEISSFKQDPLDFVLWKSAKLEEPQEVKWSSPFGEGRPGWHIECSAMSCKLLGHHFDIHGGGADLQFPHHENEIAQSVGATGDKFANYWVHNGFVRVERQGQAEKMSKSLGNFFTIRDLLKQYDPEVIRFFILRAHYRSPLTYSESHIEDAKQALSRLYKAVGSVQACEAMNWQVICPDGVRFQEAMNDDLNTPLAVSVLFDMASEVNRTGSRELAVQLKTLANVLGLLTRTDQQFFQANVGMNNELSVEYIQALIEQRNQAKADKQFARADEIRQQLLQQGVALEDGRGGTTWRKV